MRCRERWSPRLTAVELHLCKGRAAPPKTPRVVRYVTNPWGQEILRSEKSRHCKHDEYKQTNCYSPLGLTARHVYGPPAERKRPQPDSRLDSEHRHPKRISQMLECRRGRHLRSCAG